MIGNQHFHINGNQETGINEMKKNLLGPFRLIITVFLLLAGAADLFAAGPWQWHLTLRGDTPENSLLNPAAVYVDKQRERYYVVDTGNNRLMSFDISGKPISALTADNQLRAPFDMTRDKQGRLIVVEKSRNSITVIDLRAKEVKRNAITYNDRTVFIDRIENDGDTIFVLDKSSGDILELNDKFEVVKNFSCEDCAVGFVDFKLAEGSLWALEQDQQAVFQFDRSGKLKKKIDLRGGVVVFPRSLAVDEGGRFYILDRHAGGIAVFDADGKYTYSFLTPGQSNGQLLFPVEISFDPWGRLCVVEEGNGRVQIFSRQ